jgi:hypothetical protein
MVQAAPAAHPASALLREYDDEPNLPQPTVYAPTMHRIRQSAELRHQPGDS